MADTTTSRGYGIGLQADYATAKTVAAGAFKRLICSDDNMLDYQPRIADDEAYAHGQNQATEQWLEAHDGTIQHTIPGYVDQIGYLLALNLGTYSVSTPGGGTTSKQHSFKPQDPSVSRQGKAVTYVETAGPGWNVLVPRCVANGFTLRGDGLGHLTMDFGLQSAGKVDPASTATWTGGTPSVATPTDREKFFNTQVALKVTPSGESQVDYGCRYRSFEVNYQQSLLLDAGFKPGCGEFNTSGDPTSGIIRSACEFDRQTCDFTLTVDMTTGSPELAHLQAQKPIVIQIAATAGEAESGVDKSLTVDIPVAYYQTTRPTVANGIYTFTITGRAFYDYVTSKMLEVKLVNNIATYASGW